ncbi:adenylate/guanylate cyclase domain-containing protein [Occultella kanbiaonis]|uniref:adenylate/guanylate cyclase domain-containing protein n=1 Tax=Occultella kanbiaonis TaxID=2675754 RepID=UPI0013CF5265|nr:adenylate/guanylate cyclase domain-containing protein [Occultella kanbiaonis]
MTADPGSSNTGLPNTAARAPRGRFGLGIQSKLLVMLVGVGLVTSLVVGAVGFVNGREAMRADALEQLVTIRELRADQIEREFASLQLGVRLDSRNGSAVDGAEAFIDGYADLGEAQLDADQEAALLTYYADGFVPLLEGRSGLSFEPETFIPVHPAGRYLQYHYTIGRDYEDFDAALAIHDVGDGSAWSAAGAQYGPYFTGLVAEVGYEDLLVIDRDGNVAYSAYKSVDLGVDITAEPYTNSALTHAFEQALAGGSLDAVITTDFERYLPSLNVPTAWVVSPVGEATNIVGVLAIQVPISQINDVMTGGRAWSAQGLGDTGEVYLAGSDGLMRSESRLLVEDPASYVDTVVANGTPVVTAERIVELGGTVQLQPVDFHAVQQALQGHSGTASTADYTNPESLVAFAPLEIDGLTWVIVAHMDAGEAFAPATEFTRTLLLAMVAILLAVSVLSLLLAQVFTRPVRQMLEAVRRVAGGDLATQVPITSHDEFADLGNAFNDMSASLRIKQDLLEDQQNENEKLLLTLMPESVARRYREGEETISAQHDDVAVVFAELVGFDEYARKLTSDEETAQLNILMRGFDEAAQTAGVEKARALRGGFLASSGLAAPRVDSVRRALDFAVTLRGVVDRFNAQNQATLAIRAGIDAGTVTSGLIARSDLVYDLWGDAVSLAYQVGAVSTEPGIYVSQAAREHLGDATRTTQAGTVRLRDAQEPVWRVDQ